MSPNEKNEAEKIEAGENPVKISESRTARNRYEIMCGGCSQVFYADEETANYLNRLVEADVDNPFLCGDCQKELEEAMTEDR